MSKILLVEDDPLFGESIADLLSLDGFSVSLAGSFDEALELSYSEVFDLFIFDINLGQKSGLELLKEIRLFDEKKPILMLTSYTTSSVAAECFELGCDDFIRKPCDGVELLARIKSKLKESFGAKSLRIELRDGFSFELKTKTLLKDGKPTDLSQKESELLSVLLRSKNKTVTIEEIQNELWPASREPSYGSIRVYINSLKKLFGGKAIVNIKGVGYRFEE